METHNLDTSCPCISQALSWTHSGPCIIKHFAVMENLTASINNINSILTEQHRAKLEAEIIGWWIVMGTLLFIILVIGMAITFITITTTKQANEGGEKGLGNMNLVKGDIGDSTKKVGRDDKKAG